MSIEISTAMNIMFQLRLLCPFPISDKDLIELGYARGLINAYEYVLLKKEYLGC